MLFRTVYLIVLCLFTGSLNAQSKKEVIKKINEACRSLNSIGVEFEETLKQSHLQDTNVTLWKYQSINKSGIGFSKSYDSGKVFREYIYDSSKVIMYSNRFKSTFTCLNDGDINNDYHFYKNNCRYRPFNSIFIPYKRMKFRNCNGFYSFISKKKYKNYYGEKTISITQVLISKQDFLPVYFGFDSESNGNHFIHNCRLLKLTKNLDSNLTKLKIDSMKIVFNKSLNGDSIQQENIKSIKKINVKDSAKQLQGIIHGKDSIRENLFIKDSIIILDFFFTTCSPCAQSVPTLIKISETYKSKGVKLYGVNPFEGDWVKLDKYMKVFKINYDILKVNKGLASDYGVKAYPTVVIIKNGLIEFVHQGYSLDFENLIKEKLELLLK